MKTPTSDCDTTTSTHSGPKGSFTLARANRALVLVKRIVADVLAEHRRMVDLQEALDACRRDDEVQAAQLRRRLSHTFRRLRSCFDELDEVGVVLADCSAGVVHFPSRRGGREICLCWRYGEPEVSHWHETADPHHGRQPAPLPAAG